MSRGLAGGVTPPLTPRLTPGLRAGISPETKDQRREERARARWLLDDPRISLGIGAALNVTNSGSISNAADWMTYWVTVPSDLLGGCITLPIKGDHRDVNSRCCRHPVVR
jgi:hypothetical protein